MADEEAVESEEAEAPKKSGKKGLILGFVGMLVAGGGGFYATYSGALDSMMSGESKPVADEDALGITYITLDPLVISLDPGAHASHLKFIGSLEVPIEYAEEVDMLRPRVTDALNTFLRAVDPAELARTSSMTRLRAQMLRRVQVVTGEGRIRDLLVLEFVLN